ncbi:AraC family transcriptional regulator [Lachnospiraceae bacterium OttesenSCG-928-D06]|nr:AraC family transcriptional regulator [Lachnospiraceae bacterium OttesenSCG-928-D06]
MEYTELLDHIKEHIECHHLSDFIGTSPKYHKHETYELYLFLRGDVNYYIEEKGYHLIRGSLLFIPPETLHRVEWLDPKVYERCYLNFSTTFMEHHNSKRTNLLASFYGEPSAPVFLLTEQEIQEFIILLHQLKKELLSEEYGSDLKSTALLCQLLININPLQKQKSYLPKDIMPPIVRKTMDYIDSHLSEPLSLSILEKNIHNNGTYISRCMKNITGLTLQEYIIYKRIKLAEEYLIKGYSLNETCLLCGFNDYSNFSKAFKKQLNFSPKKYQLQLIKGKVF